MNDENLKREIEEALAVDPSPHLVARVRQQIAEETLQQRRQLPWKALAAGLATAVVLGAVVLYQPGTRTTAPLVPRVEPAPVAFVKIPEIEAPPPAVATARPASRRPPEPEVLIDPREAAAFHSFIDDIQERRIDSSRLQALFETAEVTRSIDDIRPMPVAGLEPIVVPPLSPVVPEREGGSL